MSLFFFSFAAAFLFVFLRATQQKNVQHNNYLLVLPVSLAMAFSEGWVVAAIAKQGYDLYLVLTIGIGSGLGCMLSMWVYSAVTAIIKKKAVPA